MVSSNFSVQGQSSQVLLQLTGSHMYARAQAAPFGIRRNVWSVDDEKSSPPWCRMLGLEDAGGKGEARLGHMQLVHINIVSFQARTFQGF